MPRAPRRARDRRSDLVTAWALTWAAAAIEGDLVNPAEHEHRLERLGPEGAGQAEAVMRRAMARMRANARVIFNRCDG